MIWFVVASFLIFVCCNEKDKSEIKYGEIASGRYLTKIYFEDHSYIYLTNSWNSSGDKLLHDPGCFCLQKDKTSELKVNEK
jgi:hypothetical protein